MKELIHCIEDSHYKGIELIDAYQEYLEKSRNLDKINKFIIVGSGSSYNSALMSKSFLEQKLNIQVELYYPNDFLNYTNHSFVTQDSLVMFISQGGQTKLVVQAARKMKELGVTSVSVTENSDSEIAKITDIVLDTNTGIEAYMYRTIGVTNTILSILLFALSYSENREQIDEDISLGYRVELNRVFDKFLDVIEYSKQWYQEQRDVLKDAKSILFSGAGKFWPVAKEADIKFMEMLPLLTNSFELEELIHGPQNMFVKDHVFFLIADSFTDLDKAKDIKRFIEEEVKATTYIIDENFSNIFEEESEFKFFLYLVFFQVIAYCAALERGRDLSHGIYPKVNDYIKKSI